MPSPLNHLRSIRNARDLAASAPRGALIPHVLYRAACPAGCDPDDAIALIGRLATLVDLRSPAERSADPPGCALMPPSPSPSHPVLVSTPIIQRLAFKRALVRALPWPVAAKVTVLSLVGARGRARATAVAALNAGGLALLYRALLVAGATGFGAALRAITESLEERKEKKGDGAGATLFFCRLGKDRTGLLAALLLSVLGAAREAILDDYSLSDGVADPSALGIALGGLEAEEGGRALAGLDPATFCAAPRRALAAALDFLDARYGGVGGYLKGVCGFGEEWQGRLVAAAAATPPDVRLSPALAAGLSEGGRARL